MQLYKDKNQFDWLRLLHLAYFGGCLPFLVSIQLIMAKTPAEHLLVTFAFTLFTIITLQTLLYWERSK